MARSGLLLPLLATAAVAACTEPPKPAAEPPRRPADLERGLALAERWCADCHRVKAGQARVRYPGNKAPPFAAIVARPAVDGGYLARFMEVQHQPMPTYRLDDTEKVDLAGYMLSLKPQR
jgi:mono/diheme cytochrome c family protein